MYYRRITKENPTPIGGRSDGKEVYNRLYCLENGIENSTVVILPCKVGDTVYYIFRSESVSSSEIDVINIRDTDITFNTMSGCTFPIDDFGKEVFLTKEAAMIKLKRLKDGNDR